ncbi:response regulator [Bacterioplanoides sp.]|uniref:response regulator n=1 Tax=Bacterioplanoides sp. TaxID=2066072 RepID=UPI003B00A668
MAYQVLLIGMTDCQQIEQQIGSAYALFRIDGLEDLPPDPQEFHVVIINAASMGMSHAIQHCQALKQQSTYLDCPVIVLADRGELTDRMDALDAGFDDFICRDSIWELKARVERVIFNQLANAQLKTQLQQANEMAFIAMSGTSDLGVNIQFLLDANTCSNLDELGMRLFKALQSYGLSCSLQMRSEHGVKNMEANGMAKAMESVLLDECKEQGRYVDFGHRSIMNYENVSLLVKNMPVDDPNKYGAIKDNVFSLLQGTHARMAALDNQKNLELEGTLVKQMTTQMNALMGHVDHSYQEVMRKIADVVETMAEGMENSVHFLGLDENQEQEIQKIMETGILDTNKTFNEGMKLDRNVKAFFNRVNQVFSDGHIDAAVLHQLLESMPVEDQKISEV